MATLAAGFGIASSTVPVNVAAVNFLQLIEAKREGKTLSPAEIQCFIRDYTSGQIPDYQMAAMLMAIYFRGLDTSETSALTLAMRDSGDVLEFPKDKRPLVDKHSTGGIGDKVSLPLAPLLACLGFRIPMVSGRGLGITGGTLDKLDSIPGFQTLLPADRIVRLVQKVGCVICGQTDRMVPADRKIYALRDASGTVPSMPLITASILSKKLAENLDALILDVKFGRAAFMPTKASATQLAKAMVALGKKCGMNTRALLTDMNRPLGRAAGNWLEVKESVAVLEGGAGLQPLAAMGESEPYRVSAPDLRALVIECAAHLLVQTRMSSTLAAGRKRAETVLDSGAPRAKWNEMLEAQGADLKAFHQKLASPHTAPVLLECKAPAAGFVSKVDARILGEAVRELGGGRLTKESSINYDVGVDAIAKPGQRVDESGTLCRVHAADLPSATLASRRLRVAFQISRKPVKPTRLIHEFIA